MILVTIPRAAELYSVSASQMRRIITDWGIPVVKIGRSGVRVRMDDLTAYAEDHAGEGRGHDLLATGPEAVDRARGWSGAFGPDEIGRAVSVAEFANRRSLSYPSALDPVTGLPPRMAG